MKTKITVNSNMSYDEMCNEILADESASEWLKRAVLALSKRDPVDSERDAEALANLQSARVSELPINA